MSWDTNDIIQREETLAKLPDTTASLFLPMCFISLNRQTRPSVVTFCLKASISRSRICVLLAGTRVHTGLFGVHGRMRIFSTLRFIHFMCRRRSRTTNDWSFALMKQRAQHILLYMCSFVMVGERLMFNSMNGSASNVWTKHNGCTV